MGIEEVDEKSRQSQEILQKRDELENNPHKLNPNERAVLQLQIILLENPNTEHIDLANKGITDLEKIC